MALVVAIAALFLPFFTIGGELFLDFELKGTQSFLKIADDIHIAVVIIAGGFAFIMVIAGMKWLALLGEIAMAGMVVFAAQDILKLVGDTEKMVGQINDSSIMQFFGVEIGNVLSLDYGCLIFAAAITVAVLATLAGTKKD